MAGKAFVVTKSASGAGVLLQSKDAGEVERFLSKRARRDTPLFVRTWQGMSLEASAPASEWMAGRQSK